MASLSATSLCTFQSLQSKPIKTSHVPIIFTVFIAINFTLISFTKLQEMNEQNVCFFFAGNKDKFGIYWMGEEWLHFFENLSFSHLFRCEF